MSNGKAPVCPISRDQAISGMPGSRFPPPPRAYDLPSLIRTINTINFIFQTMVSPTVTNNFGFPYVPPTKGTADPKQDNGQGLPSEYPDWQEKSRDISQMTVYHWNKAKNEVDRSQRVEVHRIESITFQDTANVNKHGEHDEWKWDYHEKNKGKVNDQPNMAGSFKSSKGQIGTAD